MACILIDAHIYSQYEIKSKQPLEPVCLPLEVRKKHVLKWFVLFALLMIPSMYLYSYLLDFTRYDEALNTAVSVLGIIVPASAFSIMYAAFKSSRKRMFAKLQSPAHNPLGYKYQGRVLSPADPHYQLHLHYYNMTGTWELPDEVERSGFMGQGGSNGS